MMSQSIERSRKHTMTACGLAMILVLCACNLPSEIAASAITASPTVTLTPGAGTLSPTAASPAAATTTPSAGEPASPTATVFALPPTPGRTPTEPYSTMPPHITTTPAPGEAHIDSFTASPTEIDAGGSVTLSWKAAGDSFTLFALDAQGRLNQGTPVAAEDTTTVTADPNLRSFAQFMLSATGGGKTVTSLVKVAIHCPDTWFFANPPSSCPSSSATVSDGASEHFEHGWMLWVGASGTIYVLYDQGSPRWSTYPNQWQSGTDESDPGIVPPENRYQPVRGFGLLWRTEAAGQPASPRERLGWATEPETSFSIAIQCDSTSGGTNCYIKGPLGETLWLKPNSSGWQQWAGPS